MASKLAEDPRIDPRIKAVFGSVELPALPSVASREELLQQEYSDAALAGAAGLKAFLDSMGTEEAAPSTGLSIRTVHPSGPRPDPALCLLHPWRRHAVLVLL